jgi:hypothetical protein
MANIILINPRFDVSFWGLEHALPFIGKRAALPVAALPLLAALGGAVVPDQGRSFVGLSGATFNGEGGMAFGLVHHLDGSNMVFSGGVALGTGSSQPIGRFAVGWLF